MIQSVLVGYVPASFPVNFALFTTGQKQYVAFYDTAHQMILACRQLDEQVWDYQPLDSKVGWDSHNYLAMVVDNQGYIHLTGNMHSSPLVYFRSRIPFDIHSMQAFHTMTGTEEDVVTYPEFMYGPQEEIIFHYRYGLSGSGHEIFNYWISQSQKWIRLLNRPLLDGQGKMNAYMEGPALGPDGYYHLIWVWRDTPDCATNHTLSYARSKDLRHWQSVSGENVELPITIDYPQLYVDTTMVNGGLINIGIKYGFDSGGNVIIAYHKYDSAGNSQLFLSRFQNNKWLSKQITGWDYRWDLKGYGSIVREITLESPKPYSKKGYCVLGYHHIKYGRGQIIVDEKTLAPLKIEPLEKEYPMVLDSLRSAFPGMIVNKIFDSGQTNDNRRYLLRWETLSPNRDQKQEIKIPPNSMLELVVY